MTNDHDVGIGDHVIDNEYHVVDIMGLVMISVTNDHDVGIDDHDMR